MIQSRADFGFGLKVLILLARKILEVIRIQLIMKIKGLNTIRDVHKEYVACHVRTKPLFSI